MPRRQTQPNLNNVLVPILILIPPPLRHKHHILTINVLITSIHHPHLPRRKPSPTRLERLDLRRRNPTHILLKMFVPRHNRLLDILVHILIRIRTVHTAPRGRVHLAGDEGQLVGPGEEDVEGGFELEDGVEDGAAAQDVQAQAGAREGDG